MRVPLLRLRTTLRGPVWEADCGPVACVRSCILGALDRAVAGENEHGGVA